jgi:hypothetical protein
MKDDPLKSPFAFFPRHRQGQAGVGVRASSEGFNLATPRQMCGHRGKNIPTMKGVAHRMEKVRLRGDLDHSPDLT